jgi:hypothetical protein
MRPSQVWKTSEGGYSVLLRACGHIPGDGKMIDASSSENAIRITNDIRNTAYWVDSFICGRGCFKTYGQRRGSIKIELQKNSF